MTKWPKCLFLLIFPGHGFVCSFVFLPFSEPARVLNSPISLSGTAHPKGSESACLPRKVSQLTEVGNTAEASTFTELLSVKVLLHFCGTWGDARERVSQMPPLTKTSSSIAHPQAPVPPSLAVPPCWGTETNVALRATSPAWRAGGQTACSSLSEKKPSTSSFVNICSKHVPLGYQCPVCTF